MVGGQAIRDKTALTAATFLYYLCVAMVPSKSEKMIKGGNLSMVCVLAYMALLV